MQLQKLSDETSQASRQLPRSSSCFSTHVTYICSSTLDIAVQRHRGKQSIPAPSPLRLETAAQHENEHRMTAERVPFISHAPLMDPDAPSYAKRQISPHSGNAREAALSHAPTLWLRATVHTSQTMMVMQISLTREGVVSSYKMGIRLRSKLQCNSHINLSVTKCPLF